MSWFSDLTSKAETLLNAMDKGAAKALTNQTSNRSRNQEEDRDKDWPINSESNQR